VPGWRREHGDRDVRIASDLCKAHIVLGKTQGHMSELLIARYVHDESLRADLLYLLHLWKLR